MDVVAVVLAVAVGGTVVGPGLNHAILRWIGWRIVLPSLVGWTAARAELGRPVPRCRRCATDLRARVPCGTRRLPALSWLLRLGSCPVCSEALNRNWLAVEVVTAGLLGAAALAGGWSVDVLPVTALFAGLVAVCAVDLACWRIPSRFAWGTGAVVVAGLLVASTVGSEPAGALLGAVLGSAVVGGLLGGLYLLSPRMLGFGDVRLGVVAGAVVGWSGGLAGDVATGAVAAAVGMLLVAGLGAVVAGLVLLVRRRRNAPYPFGPALAAGAVIQVLSELGR